MDCCSRDLAFGPRLFLKRHVLAAVLCRLEYRRFTSLGLVPARCIRLPLLCLLLLLRRALLYELLLGVWLTLSRQSKVGKQFLPLSLVDSLQVVVRSALRTKTGHFVPVLKRSCASGV